VTAVLESEETTTKSSGTRPLKILFMKERFAWPRASGHDIHTYYCLEALQAQGHHTSLACFQRPDRQAIECVAEDDLYIFGEDKVPVPEQGKFPLQLSKMQEKFRGYWGVDANRVRWLAAVADRCQADAVVVVGLGVLPYLGACPERVCVWYAADEWVWHHISQVRPFKKSTWSEIKPAIVKGIYERAYKRLLDRTWVVSPADQKAFRWLAGIKKTDLIHNGVDAAYYSPGNNPEKPKSCIFWGRLDFGPNVQAVEYFCSQVWPLVRKEVPDATFSILGFEPTKPVMAWNGQNGITVTPNVPDIRPAVREQAVVVLPFVSGGGVKNKLLEAAGMAKAIVGTSRVTNGLKGELPFIKADQPQVWAKELARLWRDDQARTKLGQDARTWVTTHQTWAASARVAAEGIRKALEEKKS
jgi:polysaccharide biosynthesis protein PslH